MPKTADQFRQFYTALVRNQKQPHWKYRDKNGNAKAPEDKGRPSR